MVVPAAKPKKGPRYTPVSRRHDRPNAVLWLIKNHPELKDSQLMRLVGTTKPTIAQIRERSHWNSPNLVPQDPVTLGLCSQIDLDAEVKKGAKRAGPGGEAGDTLLPTAETTGVAAPGAPQPEVEFHRPSETVEPDRPETEAEEAKRVLARLKEMSGGKREDDDEDMRR